MPQKMLWGKAPLLSVRQAFPSCGQVRTADPSVLRLYHRALSYTDRPETWEGAFQLACLVLDHPEESPVCSLIRNALADTGNGSLEGAPGEQIARARAALRLFEYTTDRSILRRLAFWFRYLEIDWEAFTCFGAPVYAPADLMELLIRYYRITGLKAILRLCVRLRSTAFDWATALNTLHQVVPLRFEASNPLAFTENTRPADLSFDEQQMLLNHGAMLADGIRYSFCSGLYSGNGQELGAGLHALSFLLEHHRAVCGGFTASPFLKGTAASAPVDTEALSALTEALTCMAAHRDAYPAAMDELVRIVMNGLCFCLQQEDLPAHQRVNTVSPERVPPADAAAYARFARAVAEAYHHAVGMTDQGLCINYLLPQQSALHAEGRRILFRCDGQTAVFRFADAEEIHAEVFRASVDTSRLALRRGERDFLLTDDLNPGSGRLLRLSQPLHDGDRLQILPGDGFLTESAHHQGLICWRHNRLQCLPLSGSDYAFASVSFSADQEGAVSARICPVSGWRLRNGEPEDVPVLPRASGEEQCLSLADYAQTGAKISLFPRCRLP